jgi:hypothetical protein
VASWGAIWCGLSLCTKACSGGGDAVNIGVGGGVANPTVKLVVSGPEHLPLDNAALV